jgi:hypothetical protein
VIMDPAAAEPPVVSRSTTQKVTSRSGRPSWSKLRWDSQRVGVGTVVLTSWTLDRAADNPRQDAP